MRRTGTPRAVVLPRRCEPVDDRAAHARLGPTPGVARAATTHALHRQILTGMYASGESARSPFRVARMQRRNTEAVATAVARWLTSCRS